MKRILALTVLAITASVAFGQNVDKLIKQSDVERIIGTLASDQMRGRATFTPDIEHAAQFIESEYKQIGLKPMSGDDGYLQNFTMTRVTPLKTLAEINGN